MHVNMTDDARILTADDDADCLQISARFLHSQGYTCDCVEDGSSAVAKLESDCYDVLISDIEMPGNHDLGLVRKAAQIAPDMPVILVTGYPSVETAAAGYNLPVFAYLVKPLNYSSLLDQVKKAVSRHRMLQSVRTAETRMSEWKESLASLRGSLESYSSDCQETSMRGYAMMTFSNMIAAFSDLKSLLDMSAADDSKAQVCRVDPCPLKQQFRLAMEDAVETLKNTKSTFKSKEIQDLRRRFERVLSYEYAGSMKLDKS